MKKTRIGYVRLCDAAPLVVAQALGSYAAESARVELVPVASWSEVRDRLITGDLQAAHCLAGIPLAAQAGMFGPQAKLATAFTLNHDGTAITLATSLAGILRSGREHFVDYVRNRRREGRPLVLASVFPASRHEYELRHWIASLGLDPQADLRLVVVSPPETARAMRNGRIDGYCVGEPWNTRAIHEGWGQCVSVGASSVPGTEKVLGVREEFLDDPAHGAILRALATASDWLAGTDHVEATLELLAPYVGRSIDELRPAFSGSFRSCLGESRTPFIRFGCAIARPDASHGRWYLEQMRSNGQIAEDIAIDAVCARAFRADVHDRWLGAR